MNLETANGRSHSDWPKASVAIVGVSALWFLSGPLLGHMGPPWPCAAAGAALAFLGFMLFYKPGYRLGWGVLVMLVSAASLLLGSGAMLPGGLGIIGGVSAVIWKQAGGTSPGKGSFT